MGTAMGPIIRSTAATDTGQADLFYGRSVLLPAGGARAGCHNADRAAAEAHDPDDQTQLPVKETLICLEPARLPWLTRSKEAAGAGAITLRSSRLRQWVTTSPPSEQHPPEHVTGHVTVERPRTARCSETRSEQAVERRGLYPAGFIEPTLRNLPMMRATSVPTTR
jgi:hypothetical protein